MLEAALNKHHTVLATDWWTERPQHQSWWTCLCCGKKNLNTFNLGTIVFIAVLFLKMAVINQWSSSNMEFNRWTKSHNYNFHMQYYLKVALIILVLKRCYCRLFEYLTKPQGIKLTSRPMKPVGSLSQISELIRANKLVWGALIWAHCVQKVWKIVSCEESGQWFNKESCASPLQGCRQRLWQSDGTGLWSLCPEAFPEVEGQSCREGSENTPITITHKQL